MLMLFSGIIGICTISAQERRKANSSPFGEARDNFFRDSTRNERPSVAPETGEIGHIIRNPFGVANPNGVDSGIDVPNDAQEESEGNFSAQTSSRNTDSSDEINFRSVSGGSTNSGKSKEEGSKTRPVDSINPQKNDSSNSVKPSTDSSAGSFEMLGEIGKNNLFYSHPMTAGKALLSENAFSISKYLDTANFSPELQLPIQLIYKSSNESSGIFGFAWYSPQLESMAYYDKDGVLWVTPWGERIKFFPKDEKTSKDSLVIELYEKAKEGRGFYAPYSEWEADTSARKYENNGNWIFTGKKGKKGWKFVYRDHRLQSVTAPSGRMITFDYSGNRLNFITQNGVKFVELQYKNNLVSSIKINGFVYELEYAATDLQILPKTESGKIISAVRPALSGLKQGDLSPILFQYDNYGFLTNIAQEDFIEKIVVQHQTLDEKKAELRAKRVPGAKYNGAINGRIASDNQLKYSYQSTKAGSITITNPSKQTATYQFDTQTGVFHLQGYSGKKYTIYYFMRHDVAYLGKVRKIVDNRGRDLINYRYDGLSGNVVRIRDIVGNDINFEYGANNKVSLITRRAADQEKPEPVESFAYDSRDNLIESNQLNQNGNKVVSTAMTYTQFNQLKSVSDGQVRIEILYNGIGYPTAIVNTFGQTTKLEYNDYNQIVSSTNPYGVKTFYTYTPAGLLSKMEQKDGQRSLSSIEILYNGKGQPVTYTDLSGKTKKLERDAIGRIIKEVFPDDSEVSYAYNKQGKLSTVLDENQHIISFDWNRFGLDSKKKPTGDLTSYVRDEYGLISKMESETPQQRENSRSMKYTYDQFDRPVKVEYGDGDIESRTYDSWGRLLSIQYGKDKKKVSCQYDYWGRLIKREDPDETITISYNPYGQRTERTIERNGVKLKESRTYDRYGRLIRIVSGNSKVEYLYSQNNQIQRQIVDGKVIEFVYNQYGQLQKKQLIDNNF